MDELDFYQYLFELTNVAFNQSIIKKIQEKLEKKWNYALSATKFNKGKDVFCGIYWSLKPDESYYPQKDYTKIEDNGAYEYLFVKQNGELIEKYFNIIPETMGEFNYTNFCFFKSPNKSYLFDYDLDLCSHLFVEYIEYIKPQRLIVFGTSLEERMKRMRLETKVMGIKLLILPHPRERLSAEERLQAWLRELNY
ncbi:MAG: pol3 finger protein [Ignavibacteria bacterium]|nr:pol3 finger protein [Ignavibacteria bacterium]